MDGELIKRLQGYLKARVERSKDTTHEHLGAHLDTNRLSDEGREGIRSLMQRLVTLNLKKAREQLQQTTV